MKQNKNNWLNKALVLASINVVLFLTLMLIIVTTAGYGFFSYFGIVCVILYLLSLLLNITLAITYLYVERPKAAMWILPIVVIIVSVLISAPTTILITDYISEINNPGYEQENSFLDF